MPSLKGPIVGLLVTAVLTVVTYLTAVDIQGGVHREYTGRRAGTKKLFAAIAEALGPTGVLMVGGLISAALVGWLVWTIRQRGKISSPGGPPTAAPGA